MKYVDWVEGVLRAAVETFDAGNGFSTDEHEIAAQLGEDRDEIVEALGDALRDLDRLGLLDVRNRLDIRPMPEARKIRVSSLSTTWPSFMMWLEDRAERFLVKVVEMSVHQSDRTAFVREVEAEDVLRELGEVPARGDADPLVRHLEQLGLVDGRGATFGRTPVFPTYAGIVRATEKVASEGQGLVLGLLEDWETANTEFKRELHLDSNDHKAEFVRDVLALANTQVTGNRYLVTGFDPDTHVFTTMADPRVTQDRIEDVLNEYADPPVATRYVTFAWTHGTGEVGILEVRRDRAKAPYRVKKDMAGATKSIRVRQVFVRHNSHVAEASPEEIADIEAEAKRARSEG